MNIHLSIKQRMMFGFTLLVVLIIITSAAGLLYVRTTKTAFQDTVVTSGKGYDQIQSIFDLQISWLNVVSTIGRLLLTHEVALVDDLNQLTETFDRQLNALQAQPIHKDQNIQDQEQQISYVQSIGSNLKGAATELGWIVESGDWDKAERMRRTEIESFQSVFNNRLEQLKVDIEEDVNDAVKQTEQDQAASERNLSIYWAIAIVLALLASFGIASLTTISIIRPLQHLMNAVQEFGRGNFAVRAQTAGRDELSKLAGVFNNMADELRSLVETLEDRVRQRTHELELARNEAEKANQVKSQFLANMSHELRTPLNAILNLTGFVSEGYMGPVNPEQAESLQTVVTSGNHLLNLINDILDIAKIEVGKTELFIEDVDLNMELKGVMATIQGLIKDKPVKLVDQISRDLPHISGDGRRLHQVFLNLLSNAVKFTPQGNITISANCRDGEVLVAIRDTGVGIRAEDQALIFEPFRQAEHGLRTGQSSTGLGLPISKHFVEAHGGKLWMESVYGEGSAFFVTLPIKTT